MSTTTTRLRSDGPTAPNPSDLAATAAGTITAKMLVDGYANALLQQTPLTLDKLPDLNGHLKTAQANASAWVTQISPQMVLRITDVIGFGDIWAAFSPEVQKAVQAGNTALVVQLLQVMRDNHLAPLEQSAKDAATSANGLQVKLAADKGNFDSDMRLGTSVYEGDQGAIAQLQQANDKLQSSMSQMMTLIAGSAVAIVVGGLIVAVGALAEIPTAGASTVLVAGGLVVAGAGIAGVTVGAVEYNKELDAYRQNLVTIAQDQAEMTALTGMHGQVTNLVTSNQQAQSALTSIANSWTTIGGLFDNMIRDVQTGITVPAVVVEELKAADLEWATLTTTATALANNLGVAKLQVDTSQPAMIVVHDDRAAA